jgi:tRNA(Ile)-lysidine synthase
VVVALSGGPDSTALLVMLSRLTQSEGMDLIVAHFNHGLRGAESKEDENFARSIAEKLGLDFITGRMRQKVKKGVSPEDFYRQQRYNFLNNVAKKYQAQKIALGHNRNDQAETVLLNILRGSGLDGLKGMLPIRDELFIRPLIETAREEIIAFLEKEGISFREDSSNKNKQYLRNKVRMELMPYLQKDFNPQIEKSLALMAEIMRQENQFIQQAVEQASQSSAIEKKQGCFIININYLKELHPAIQMRLLKEVLECLDFTHKGISFAHVTSLHNLTYNQASGKKITLPGKIEARREYDNLYIEIKNNKAHHTKHEYPVEIPGSICVTERKVTFNFQIVTNDKAEIRKNNKFYFDADKIDFPLVLRNKRDGDWFQPLGMKGRQKLKSLFIDHKISRVKRDKIVVLADRISVIWIENMHLSDRTKISLETKNVLELEII